MLGSKPSLRKSFKRCPSGFKLLTVTAHLERLSLSLSKKCRPSFSCSIIPRSLNNFLASPIVRLTNFNGFPSNLVKERSTSHGRVEAGGAAAMLQSARDGSATEGAVGCSSGCDDSVLKLCPSATTHTSSMPTAFSNCTSLGVSINSDAGASTLATLQCGNKAGSRCGMPARSGTSFMYPFDKSFFKSPFKAPRSTASPMVRASLYLS
mmetsp:Transcript_31130/g.49703  ORF Transcript_31130/g.49703 Transcript_31130/m.49703 type:complete len:208 (+) Transcript_31130:438-1061(+)